MISTARNQILAFCVLLVSVILPVTQASAQNDVFASKGNISVSTDVVLPTETRIAAEKAVYAAGEIVVINGSGFAKFEPVIFSVERVSAFQKVNDLMASWTVAADENGVLRGEWSCRSRANSSSKRRAANRAWKRRP